MDVALLVPVLHLVTVSYLAGLVWVVQLVVYPGFRAVGPTAAWPAFHRAHGRAMAWAVAAPWAVQGATLGVLLLRRPAGVPLWLVLLAAALALVTVGVTVASSVPLHGRLQPYDPALADRLVATNWLRTAAWTAGAGVAAAMVLSAS
ncbi:MAG TPA: hypothetical protein VFR07_07485 [Mycobacteriales bacterium]|nr:hypothetical protein [Mycobacteriales bacterium]